MQTFTIGAGALGVKHYCAPPTHYWASKPDPYLLATHTESSSYMMREYIIVNVVLTLLFSSIPWVFGLSPLQRLHAKARRQCLKFVRFQAGGGLDSMGKSIEGQPRTCGRDFQDRHEGKLFTYFSSNIGPFIASTLPYFLFLVATS